MISSSSRNRLAATSNPYLLQHAANPVDWYPWGDEAFSRARQENKPIFLSVGYSSCHWCHVMAHESFENPRVAEVLNRHFVSIKVDREERPDIDELYMTATQVMTGQGGWPNSVFLLPDGRPFFAGTYFPPEDRWGRMGFRSLLEHLSRTWEGRREDVERQAAALADAIRSAQSLPATNAGGEAIDERVLSVHAASFDEEEGGFGGAPKFPPHAALRLLLESDDAARRMATRTLDAIVCGGIHDIVGGGFHRYAVDEIWLVPHFEKMLYDNAQLLQALARAEQTRPDPLGRLAARRLVAWIDREMTSPDGLFYSALDADTEGVEGATYVWPMTDLVGTLGERSSAAAQKLGAREDGNFVDPTGHAAPRTNILNLGKAVQGLDADARAAVCREIEPLLASLLERRLKRAQPFLDEKILTGWNGMMIGALAIAGAAFGEHPWITKAERAASMIISGLERQNRLSRCLGEATASGSSPDAFLEDYAYLGDGLLDLHAATGAVRWREAAQRIFADLEERFRDPAGGGYFNSAGADERIFVRSKTGLDNATPAGNGIAAIVAARLGGLTGEDRYFEAASLTVESFRSLAEHFPAAAASLARAERLLPSGHRLRDRADRCTEDFCKL